MSAEGTRPHRALLTETEIVTMAARILTEGAVEGEGDLDAVRNNVADLYSTLMRIGKKH